MIRIGLLGKIQKRIVFGKEGIKFHRPNEPKREEATEIIETKERAVPEEKGIFTTKTTKKFKTKSRAFKKIKKTKPKVNIPINPFKKL